MIARTNAHAADLLVAGLVDAGVRAAVASPGSRNTPLVLALAARSDLDLHVVLDERVAGFLALGLARASGRPVALACTSGSAGAHYLPALIEARHSRVPLVAITADRPPELHGCGAPQTIDQRDLFGRYARESLALMPPDDARDLRSLRAAAAGLVRAATRRPAAPVHLDAAFREPLWAPGVTADPPTAQPTSPNDPPLAPPPPAVVDRLRAARRGVVVAGPDARDAAPLARALGWPLLAEPAADAGRATPADALLRGPFARPRPDRALHLGLAPTSKALRRWLTGVELYTVDPAGQNRSGTPDARVVATDAATLAAAILAAAIETPTGDPAWRRRWQLAQETARSILDAHCQTGPLWGGAVAHHLAAAARRHGAALHAGNSMAIRDLDFAAALPTPLYTSRGANGIDGTLATAAGEGIALGHPIAVLLGDLSALHDVGGLLHAGQTGHPLTAVIVDNRGGGIFEYLAIAEHPERFERLFATPQPARFDALTAAAGGRYHPVDALPALTAALDAALPRPGLDVVHCVIDREGDTARHRAAWAAVATATEAT